MTLLRSFAFVSLLAAACGGKSSSSQGAPTTPPPAADQGSASGSGDGSAALSGEGEPCSDDVAVQKKCQPGLVCVMPTSGPISEHTPGSCQKPKS
jgi:hypothetical protein